MTLQIIPHATLWTASVIIGAFALAGMVAMGWAVVAILHGEVKKGRDE